MPKAMCLTCHRLIPHGSTYCTEHRPKRKAKTSPRKRGLDYTYDKHRKITLGVSSECVLCGKPGANSADHIKPRAFGVDNSLHNLIPAHLSCNSARQDKPLNGAQQKRMGVYLYLLDSFLEANANVRIL